MDPPVVPSDRLDGWRRVAETTDRPFAAGPVSVIAGTVVYERATGPQPRSFCFASRLRIRPATAPNAALTGLVERRARDGFRDRLAERDIDGIEHRGDRELSVDDPSASRATLSTFEGRFAAPSGDEGGGLIPIEALLAVWEAGEYLLGGGAYPLGDGAEAARRELVRIVRGIRSPGGSGGGGKNVGDSEKVRNSENVGDSESAEEGEPEDAG
ncbi:hypothetical protein [Halorubrum trueperi]|uniref:Uncharacterized protein n=1 Tax=Halorubrum trueperi TaxID=2004704 RepID=A0ABD5UJM2_9EURY